MTDEQIEQLAYKHSCDDDEPLFSFSRGDLFAFARALLADGGKGEAVYQVRSGYGWIDVSEGEHANGYQDSERRIVYTAPQAECAPREAQPVALTDAQIEAGWRQTFSTDNPYCPCNLKSFTKAVRWAERAKEKK
jgi:hypothetical protein